MKITLSWITKILDSKEQKAFDAIQTFLCWDYVEQLRTTYGWDYSLMVSKVLSDAKANAVPKACIATCGKIRRVLKKHDIKI